jgi:ATP-dependent helicase/DNAse subunit B
MYGKCSYRYFAGEVLKLEEKEEGIDARQVGIILHDVLENYWKERVEKGNKELGDVQTAEAFVKGRLQELLKESPLLGERAYRVELKKSEMEDWLVRMVRKEIEVGPPLPPFRPRYFEFEFGLGGGTPPLKLHDPYREDMLLRGKIDRIEVDPTGRLALVIDYKTGDTFKMKDLEFGTALQLPLYLLVVQQHLKLRPLGGVIYQIKSGESRGFFLREGIEGAGAQVHSRSLLDKKEFDGLLEKSVRFARKFADGITRAEVTVKPRLCDKYCPYPSVCRIEKWRLPFIYQDHREEDKKNGLA